ncbi:hypothetical protein Q6348_08115 [Isoptericola sp. b441]|uniref:Uncharacterized protein n=1 Tax=Actinotalea lenta TaxID=3064654 RepID=A0ABT9D8F0_9CELL|nr:hypothetical protein [Isoptericola sp. b441]MDO8107160.1 hypothetical protein [Isoptericola sp. b441]
MASRSAVPPLEPSAPSDEPSPTDDLIPPRTSRPLGGITFAEPTQDPTPTPDPVGEDWPSPDDEPADETDAPSAARRTSSAASSDSPFSKAAIRDAARALVVSLGELAHDAMARDRAAQAVELWRTDDEDAENIGDPLGSVANRHMGDMGAANNPDVGDLIAAGVGIAVYLFKQMGKARSARELRRQALEQPRTPEGPPEGQERPAQPPADPPQAAEPLPAPMGPDPGRYGL